MPSAKKIPNTPYPTAWRAFPAVRQRLKNNVSPKPSRQRVNAAVWETHYLSYPLFCFQNILEYILKPILNFDFIARIYLYFIDEI